MAKPTDEWFGQAFGKAWKDKAEEIGRFNLAIFGKTGVGKSTLLAALAGRAKVFSGRIVQRPGLRLSLQTQDVPPVDGLP